MKFELEPYNRNTPDEKLISDVKRVASELNKDSVTIDKYKERGSFHVTTLTRRFGSWFKVLDLAGLQKNRSPLNIPEEELFQNLEEIWTKLGRQPKNAEMHKPLSKYSAGTYGRRFGTWRKALEKFVAYINNEENISSEKAIQNLEIESYTRHKTKRNINWRLRFLVMRRDNFKCRICGKSPALIPGLVLEPDHIISWDKGGETIMENLQTLCNQCNIGKSNLEPTE
jgi:hypothetical protein